MKPVVHYLVLWNDLALGEPALCLPVDHPAPEISNTKLILTSPVIAIRGDEFETENTVYRPVTLN